MRHVLVAHDCETQTLVVMMKRQLATIWIFVLGAASSSMMGCSAKISGDDSGGETGDEDIAERFARVMCRAEFDCRCGLHASLDECETQTKATFDAIVDMGVSVNEACLEEHLESPVFSECADDPEPRACIAMVGIGEIGEPCIAWNLFTMLPGQTCRGGLQCSLTGICEDPNDPVPLATEPCNPEFWLACGRLRCDAKTHRCVPRVADGEPCTNLSECQLGSYCGIMGNCEPKIEIGQPCSSVETRPCVSEAWCDATSTVCMAHRPFICVNQPVGL